MAPKILIIDDEPEVLNALRRILSKDYEILGSESGQEALNTLSHEKDLALLLCDQRMPEMTGVAFLKEAKEICPKAIRILLTGYSDIEAVISAINEGAIYRYLTKPWEPEILKQEIKNALEYYEFLRSKDHFLMLIAHELRTPLTTILAYSDNLITGVAKTKAEGLKFAKRILEGAQRLYRMIEEILELTQLEVKKIKVSPEKGNLEPALEKAWSQLKDKAQAKKIKFQMTDCHKSLKFDALLVKKAFHKLFEFVIEAADEETTIHVGGKDSDIQISYKGKLLTDHQAKHLFEPFTAPGDVLLHPLSGLGLPIAKAIIEAHGWTVHYSTPGVIMLNFSSR